MKSICYSSRGQTVFGYAHVPQTRGKAPAILMCHGFTGCAQEGSRLFVRFAEQACRLGFYVMRIDFLGSGNSELDFATYTTPSGWIEDAKNGIRFLKEQPEVDPDRIAILGVSLGGFTALMTGAETDVAAVVGWAPVLNPAKTFRGILTEYNWDYLLAGNRTIEYIYCGNHFAVGSKFVQDLERMSVTESLKRYRDIPVLIMQGSSDAVIDPQDSVKLKQSGVFPFQHVMVEGEEHSFLLHEKSNFSTTLDFLRRALLAV